MKFPGKGTPTVPIVSLGVVTLRLKVVPFVDHLDEKRPSEVEKPP